MLPGLPGSTAGSTAVGALVGVMGQHPFCIAAVVGRVPAHRRPKRRMAQHFDLAARREECVHVLGKLLAVDFPVPDCGCCVTDTGELPNCRTVPCGWGAQRGDRVLHMACKAPDAAHAGAVTHRLAASRQAGQRVADGLIGRVDVTSGLDLFNRCSLGESAQDVAHCGGAAYLLRAGAHARAPASSSRIAQPWCITLDELSAMASGFSVSTKVSSSG